MKIVKIKFSEKSMFFRAGYAWETLENITEIHFNYDNSGRIAFESDSYGTGYTYAIAEIAEFEAQEYVEKHEKEGK